jgi:pyruvate dehydrogenase E2 component (dihydrolipoamide acetyltransferase)
MSTIEVKVPDIGDFKEVEVIEVLVKAGEAIAVEQSLITVESDKASMEIPSPAAGVLKELRVKVGDKVAEGTLLAVLEAGEGAPASAPAAEAQKAPSAAEAPAQAAVGTVAATAAEPPAAAVPARATSPVVETAVPARPPSPTAAIAQAPDGEHGAKAHASPSVRKFARELGVELAKVKGSGPKERVTHDDVRAWVKGAIARAEGGAPAAASAGGEGAGLGLIPWPRVDFAKFGPIETKPVARIRKISAANLHRNWVMIPHVTNHDEADITELEAFRVQLNQEQGKAGVKVTMLAFLIKACVSALQKFPEFNSSLDGENVVLKNYWHIGFAADTPNGLMVPVIRDADKKGIFQIAQETSALAAKAREGKLSPADMQGGTFSISSLGGIGGTYFTPIINAPEVAILGVCRSFTKPVWNGEKFEPRLILPLSLSWDHRVVDGAAAARFNVYLAHLLADFRRVML